MKKELDGLIGRAAELTEMQTVSLSQRDLMLGVLHGLYCAETEQSLEAPVDWDAIRVWVMAELRERTTRLQNARRWLYAVIDYKRDA